MQSELFQIVRSIKITSPSNFLFNGNEYGVTEYKDGADEEISKTPHATLIDTLTHLLYRECYCRAGSNPPNGAIFLGDRHSFVHELSQANTGKGTWDHGWEVLHIEDDGRIAVSKNDLTIWVSHEQFILEDRPLVAGKRAQIRVGKELFGLNPGFYMALGDHIMEDDKNGCIVRIYWHIKAGGARHLMKNLTTELNKNGTPFRFKTLSEPSYYGRADAAVLYICKRYYAKSLFVMANARNEVKSFLDKSIPLFTKRLASGIGLAEDPPNGESFGLNRCRLVAEALFRCYQKAIDRDGEKLTEIRRGFEEAGLDLEYPYLNSRSRNGYKTIKSEDLKRCGKK